MSLSRALSRARVSVVAAVALAAVGGLLPVIAQASQEKGTGVDRPEPTYPTPMDPPESAAVEQRLPASTPIESFRTSGASGHPPFDPAKATLVDRTETGDIYRNADGTNTLRAFSGPVNFKNAKGDWERIDKRLVAHAEGYRNVAGPFAVSLPKRSGRNVLAEVRSGPTAIGLGVEGAGDRQGQVKDSHITFPDALPDADVSVHVLSKGVQQLLTLHRRTPAMGEGRWRFPLTVRNAVPSNDPNGSVVFRADNQVVAVMPPGTAFDGTVAGPDRSPSYTRVNVSLSPEGDAIDVSVDPAWLADPDRVFPVTIDPELDLGHGKDTWGTDVFVGSGCGNCRWNGGNQWNGAAYVNKIGYTMYGGGNWEWYSYLYYDLGPAMGAAILRGDWYGKFHSARGAFSMWPVSDFWDASTIQWFGKPNHRGERVDGAPGVNTDYHRDLTYWVSQWANGRWASYGISMDTAGRTADYLEMYANESSGNQSYIDVLYDHDPALPTNLAPPSGTRVSSLTPKLSAVYEHNDPGVLGACIFEVWDNALTALVAFVANETYGLSPPGSPCWATVPAPYLQWGTTYQWRVKGWDQHSRGGPYTEFRALTTPSPPPPPPTAAATPVACTPAAAVTWTAPDDDGGTPVTGYRVRALNPDGSDTGISKTVAASDRTATVDNLARGSSYYFGVAALNAAGAGTERFTANVAIVTTPSAPQNVSATADPSGLTATVEWLPPLSSGGAPVDGYTVRVFDAAGTFTGKSVTTDGTARSATVVGLTPGTTYRFSVTATNCAGDGAESAHTTVTQPSQPTAPGDVVASGGIGTISATWAAPASDGGTPVTGYSARLHLADGTDTGRDSGRLAAVDRAYSFDGLPRATAYFVVVHAYNGVGQSPPGQSGVSSTHDTPSAAQNVNAVGGVGAITATWSAPASDGGAAVTGYTAHLYLADGGDTGRDSGLLSSGAFDYTFSGLPRATSYYVVVTPHNAVGSGPVTRSNDASTADVPGAPTNVRATNGPWPGSANVRWTPPSDNGGDALTGHVVRIYNEDGTPSGLPDQYTCGTCTMRVIIGLAPSRGYLFGVSAGNGVGEGPEARTSVPVRTAGAFTMTKSYQPLADKPLAVGDVVLYQLRITNIYRSDQRPASLVDMVPASLAAEGTEVELSYISGDQPHTARLVCATTEPSSEVLSCVLGTPTADGSRPLRILNMPAFEDSATVSFPAVLEGDAGDCSAVTNTAAGTDTGGGVFSASSPLTLCDTGLGHEPWWTMISRPVGAMGTASVNTANGNLVVTQTDSAPVQAHGRLGYVLRRTYNSQDTTIASLPGSLGAGWSFNVTETGDGADGGLGSTRLYVPAAGSSVLNPLAVTLIDRDGTRHVFRPKGLSAALPLSAVPSAATPKAIAAAVGTTVCVDETFTSPAGVHVGLWRYIQVTAVEPGSCAPASGTTPQVLGFGAERTDRVRYEFDATGRMLSMQDAAGVELRYVYESVAGLAVKQLTAVFEAGSCTAPGGTPTTRDAIPASCRAFRFAYELHESPSLATRHIDVTDPAGRVTRYAFDDVPVGPQHLLSVTNPDGSVLRYTYGDCGGSPNQLCSASDGRGATTTFVYEDGGLGRQPRVKELRDRRVSAGDPDALPMSFAYGSGTTTAVQGGHQTLVQGIDAAGRAGVVEVGETPAPDATTWKVLQRTVDSWDTRDAPCRLPDDRADNNLCRRVRHALREGSPDDDSSWLYNSEGRVLRERRRLDQATTLDQTFGYRTQFVGHTATAVVDDVVTGGGNVSVGARPDSAATLFALSDATQSLTPRGNQAADHVPYLTTDRVDNAPNVRPNTVPAPVGGSTAVCADPAAPTSNTGLVCETSGPAFDATGAPTVSRTTYDRFGQKASMTTAKAVAERATTSRATCPAYGGVRLACYSYDYYADYDAQSGAGDRDLSGNVSAGGWLKAVTDPSGAFVAFAYDRGGNVVRTWDRNATAGHTVGSAWANLASPPSPRYEERYYGPYANAPSEATPFSAPWRYQLSSRDPLGNVTTNAVDANGNVTSTTPPRGNLPGGTVNYTTTQTFDAGDNLVSRTTPLESGPEPKPWRWTYDAFGNKIVERNANDKGSAWTYDAANRNVGQRWSRSSDPAEAPDACGQAAADDPLFAGKYVCASATAYDGVDNAREVQDGNGITTTVAFDAVQRSVATSTPRTLDATGNVVASTQTETRYDADGRVTDQCSARLFTEGNGVCDATSLFSAHTTYDVAGRPSSTTTYRQAGQPLVSTTTYDADGNAISMLDPNGNATPVDTARRVTSTYDLLGRRVTETRPRSTGAAYTTSWNYDAAGNTTAVVRPGDGSRSRVTAHGYDWANRLVETVVAADNASAHAAGLPDPAAGLNERTRMVYDADGHVVARYNPRAFVPYTNTTGTPVTDPRQTPNPAFMVRTDVDANGRETVQYTPRYDARSAPSMSEAQNQTGECATGVAPYPSDVGVCISKVSYDPVGNRVDMVLPTARDASTAANRHIEIRYTNDNLPAAVVAPSPRAQGARVTAQKRVFDGAGRVVKTTDALGHSTVTDYSADGLVVRTTGEPGTTASNQLLHHVTRSDYDANGNVSKVTDAAGHTTTTSYFADGKTKATEDALGNRTEYVYDSNGNPTRVYSPAALAVDSENDNNTGGIPTVNAYTHDNLLASTVVPVTPNGAERRRVAYSYDPAGRKTAQQTQRVAVTPSSAHDPATANVVTLADGGTQSFTYFPTDRPASETGRSLASGAAATGRITFGYDAAGNRTTVSDSTSSTPQITATYYLDDLARTVHDGRITMSYAYNGAGQRVLADKPGARIKYGYGDAGLPVSAVSTGTDTSVARWGWSHDDAGRLVKEDDTAGGRTVDLTWNADGTLARHRVAPTSGAVVDWSYTYDELYRIRTQSLPTTTPGAGGTPAGALGTFEYTYDAAGRLDSFRDQLGRRSVKYDRNGNRVDFGRQNDAYTGIPKARHFTYNADDSIATEQVDGATPKQHAYSAAGNLVNDGQFCTRYDGFDRTANVAAATLAGCAPTNLVTYTYDGLDRRRSSSDGVRTVSTSYDGLDEAMTAEDVVTAAGTASATRAYILGPNSTTKAMLDGTTLYHLAQDGTGNITTVTREGGGIVCTARFDPFGTPAGTTTADPHGVCNSGTTENSVFYRGARRDDATGSYQFGSRTYDPAKAAFTTPDSYRSDGNGKDLAVGVDPLTRNTYSYVNGDPVNLVDPDGHAPWNQCPDGDCDPHNPHSDATPAGTTMVGKEHSRALAANREAEAARAARVNPFTSLNVEETEQFGQCGADAYVGREWSDACQQLRSRVQLRRDVIDLEMRYLDAWSTELRVLKNGEVFPEDYDRMSDIERRKWLRSQNLRSKDEMINLALSFSPGKAGRVPRAAKGIVDDTVRMAEDWLGPNVRVITNRAGDKVFLSEKGLRRIRFDINNPAPHISPHAHVEELVDGRWVKSGPIFPRDTPQR